LDAVASISAVYQGAEALTWTAVLRSTPRVLDFFGYAAIAGSPVNAAAKSAHDCDRFKFHIH